MKLSNRNIISARLLFEYRRLNNMKLDIPYIIRLKIYETDTTIKCDIKLEGTLLNVTSKSIEDESPLKLLSFFKENNNGGFYAVSETKVHDMIQTLKYSNNMPAGLCSTNNIRFALNLQIQQDIGYILSSIKNDDEQYTSAHAIVTRGIISRNILLMSLKDIFKR